LQALMPAGSKLERDARPNRPIAWDLCVYALRMVQQTGLRILLAEGEEVVAAWNRYEPCTGMSNFRRGLPLNS